MAGNSAGDGVSAAGATVTIGAAGTYRISGTLSDGQLVVDTDAEGIVRLVLDGVSIANGAGAGLG